MMKFLHSPNEVTRSLSNYRAYLESVRHSLPASAYEFAAAPWHYDHSDHRCPHDSWLETLAISEPGSGDRRHKRHIEIAVRLFGAFHDGHLELSYLDVQAYSLAGDLATDPATANVMAHGDWLVDEVRLSEKNLVYHEILFSSGRRWLIESGDIKARWSPA